MKKILLIDSANKFADQAEAQQIFRLLSKPNDTAVQAKAKSAEIVVIERAIQTKLQELL
jgi:hypothetical protein